MDALDADVLYAGVGDVAWSFPIMQGDVFRDVSLPGFDTPMTVQVVMHPCVMREGDGRLRPRITVAPVVEYEKVTGYVWAKHLRVMPLPKLVPDGGTDHATAFVDTTSSPSSELTLERRIATLSQPGLLVLQQRLIVHATRYAEVDLESLRKQSAPVLMECELQTDWVEAVIERGGQTLEVVDAATTEFLEWLGNGEGSRRERLYNEANYPALRRETRAEIALRYE